MKYLHFTNKWFLIINLLLFIIPTYGLLFIIITGIIQVFLGIIIAFNISKLNKNGKLLFLTYSISTLTILVLTYITYGEKLYFNNTIFIIVMVISILLAILHLKITHLLYKAETHETPTNIFMQGNWEDLIMTTFEVNENCLDPYLPKGTEVDLYNSKALLSMVAFTFKKVKFFGIKIPLHQNFGQINFRFYVKSKTDSTKGVVFIKEFAPKPMIALVANLFYNEPYHFKNIKYNKFVKNNNLTLEYSYKNSKISAKGILPKKETNINTLEAFVVDRYVAFIKSKKNETFQYKIYHKPWQLYSIKHNSFDKSILNLLPKEFKNLKHISTCFVDGSSVGVEKGKLQSN